jgi:hypothetical protein
VSAAIAVVVRCSDEARIAEALRAAVGLTLRGARVTVYREQAAASVASPRVQRAVETLRLLGHAVVDGAPGAALRSADAVEVWT